MAEDMDLDLVEISPNSNPPVCKLIDYKKFLYEQKRKQKELKSKQQSIIIDDNSNLYIYQILFFITKKNF